MAVRTDLDEEGGEGYFASVSDLMVGVLFVFLLMLTVFALNFRDAEQVAREEYEKLKAQLVAEQELAIQARKEAESAKRVAEAAQAEAEVQKSRNKRLVDLLRQAVAQLNDDLHRRQAMRERLLKSLEASLSERDINVIVDPEAGILRLSGDVLFDLGRAEYRQEATATLHVLAQSLAETLPCYSAGVASGCSGDVEPILETVLIEGHTDRQSWGGLARDVSQARNDELSAQRALRVFQTLRRTAPVLDDLRSGADLPLFGISGYGERRPLGGDFAEDRRIDVRFVLSSRTSQELEALKRRIDELLEASR